MEAPRKIHLTVPGTLYFRRVAVRTIREACVLVGQDMTSEDGYRSADSGVDVLERSIVLTNDFDVNVVSAFGEIFNNIALHAYAGSDGEVDIQIAIWRDRLVITITDDGESFDISTVPPPDALPEHGMGIHLARLMLDELTYQAGPPNVWRLVKHKADSEGRADGDSASESQ